MTWRPVVGHENSYEVSEDGRVRTKARVVQRGCVTSKLKAKELKTVLGGRCENYLRVMLSAERKRHAYVHHLVAEAFLGEQPNDTVICHKNDISKDNRAANLYYGTREENDFDKYINALPLETMEEAPF
jgi:hypothetical protein